MFNLKLYCLLHNIKMNSPTSEPHNNSYVIDCSSALKAKITSELYIGQNQRKHKKKNKDKQKKIYYPMESQNNLNYLIGKQYYLNYPASYNNNIFANND